ncbi:hypothetical protein Tco_1555567 [Tanacetum coccineum]
MCDPPEEFGEGSEQPPYRANPQPSTSIQLLPSEVSPTPWSPRLRETMRGNAAQTRSEVYLYLSMIHLTQEFTDTWKCGIMDDLDDLVDKGMAFVQEKDVENQGKIGVDDIEVVKGSGERKW